MKVVAIDPGGGTGIAWVSLDPGLLAQYGALELIRLCFDGTVGYGGVHTELCPGGYDGELWHVRKVGRWLQNLNAESDGAIDVLVLEDFVMYTGEHSADRKGTIPMRLCTGLYNFLMTPEMWGEWFIGDVVFYLAAQAKGYVTDQRLKSSGLWIKGEKRRHERDAIRHLALALNNIKTGKVVLGS